MMIFQSYLSVYVQLQQCEKRFAVNIIYTGPKKHAPQGNDLRNKEQTKLHK